MHVRFSLRLQSHDSLGVANEGFFILENALFTGNFNARIICRNIDIRSAMLINDCNI